MPANPLLQLIELLGLTLPHLVPLSTTVSRLVADLSGRPEGRYELGGRSEGRLVPSRAAGREAPPSAFAAPGGHLPRPASPTIAPSALHRASVPLAAGSGAEVSRYPTAPATARRRAPASPPPPPPPPPLPPAPPPPSLMVDEAPQGGGDDGKGKDEGGGEGRGETDGLSRSCFAEASARYQRDSISSCGTSPTGQPSFDASCAPSAEAARFAAMVAEGEEKRQTALTGAAKCRRDALPELSTLPPHGALSHSAALLSPLVGDDLGGGAPRAAFAADTYGELPLGLVRRHVKSAGVLPRSSHSSPSHRSPSHRFAGAGSTGAPVLMNYPSGTIAAAAGGSRVRGRGVRAAEARQQLEAHAALGRVLRDSGAGQGLRKAPPVTLPAEARAAQVQARGGRTSPTTNAFAPPPPGADGGSGKASGKGSAAEAELRRLRSIVERARQDFPAFTERGTYCATNAAHLARVYKACFQELVRQVNSKMIV